MSDITYCSRYKQVCNAVSTYCSRCADACDTVVCHKCVPHLTKEQKYDLLVLHAKKLGLEYRYELGKAISDSNTTKACVMQGKLGLLNELFTIVV